MISAGIYNFVLKFDFIFKSIKNISKCLEPHQ